MKLIMSFIMAVSALTSSNAVAVLPPGYEDYMWCPPGDCKIYTNHYEYGFAGPTSAFYYCYDSLTGNVTDGVWTGSLTDVKPPAGWEEPEICSKEVYSECDYNKDCVPAIRSMAPEDEKSSLCYCFADSVFEPFDQCEGKSDCIASNCATNQCDDRRGKCHIGENGAGTCIIGLKSSRSDDDDDWTRKPSKKPTRKPTKKPSKKPTRKPTKKPSKKPTRKPTRKPSYKPSPAPTEFPTSEMPTDSGNTCGISCNEDKDCFQGGFVQCGTCNKVHGTQGYNTCVETVISNPTLAPSVEERVTDMPIYESMPMEDLFVEKKKMRGSVRGSNVNKDFAEFGRTNDGEKAIA